MEYNAYYNGVYCDIKDLKIPLTDRSIYFGDGIYDAAIGRNGKIYLLERHIDRFFENANKLNLNYEFKREELSNILSELVYKSRIKEYFIYFQLSRNAKFRSHTYPEDAGSNLLITISPYTVTEHSVILKLITYPDLRYSMCNIKTINLIPAVLASKEASNNSCDEAVFIRDNIVTECAHSNIFILKDDVLITHPINEHILPGITRGRLIELTKQKGIEVVETKFTKTALYQADNIIITSTSKLAIEAEMIDSVKKDGKKGEIANLLCSALLNDYIDSTE